MSLSTVNEESAKSRIEITPERRDAYVDTLSQRIADSHEEDQLRNIERASVQPKPAPLSYAELRRLAVRISPKGVIDEHGNVLKGPETLEGEAAIFCQKIGIADAYYFVLRMLTLEKRVAELEAKLKSRR
jgi:hypothetical protein